MAVALVNVVMIEFDMTVKAIGCFHWVKGLLYMARAIVIPI